MVPLFEVLSLSDDAHEVQTSHGLGRISAGFRFRGVGQLEALPT